VATHRAHITGVSSAEAEFYFVQNGKPNPIYRKNAECVTSVVLLWPGVVASFASTYIMWKSIQHNDAHGPFSSKYKNKGEEASIDLATATNNPQAEAAPTETFNGHARNPAPTSVTGPQPYPST